MDKIKVPQGEYNQSRNKVDRVRILAKVTVRVACDEMLIGEDHQMKEQKNNSREVQVSSQQEGCKTVTPSRRWKCTTPAPERRSISGRGMGSSQRKKDGSSQWGDNIKVTQHRWIKTRPAARRTVYLPRCQSGRLWTRGS